MDLNYKIYIHETTKRLFMKFDNPNIQVIGDFLSLEFNLHINKLLWLLKYTEEILNGSREEYPYGGYNEFCIDMNKDITQIQLFEYDASIISTKEFYDIALNWLDAQRKFIEENPFNDNYIIIRKVNELDKNDFLTMADEFYHSSAVDHTISKYNHERTFKELMKSDTYASADMIELNGISVGYVLFAKTYSNEAGGMVLWIEELYIREKYRGRGVGKYVLNNILQYPRDYCENVCRIRLEITPSNESAKKLYQSVGFKILDYSQMIKDI